MCGIIGVVGKHDATPILLDSLERLEYRGYDSAGIAVLENSEITRRREVGKLVNLRNSLNHEPIIGKIGIGHTRWATHGSAQVKNAHPHQAGRVTVVHNGIIENYVELRAELNANGFEHDSETDTESVAILTNHFLEKGLSPKQAVIAVQQKLTGNYALCFLFSGENDLIIATCCGSPLVVGFGQGEMFVGSDSQALAPLTQKITHLKDKDIALLSSDGVEIYDAKGRLANRPVEDVPNIYKDVDKAGHRHYMIKEIFEQPKALQRVLGEYWDNKNQDFKEPLKHLNFSSITRIRMVACGTAYLSCMQAKYWFEQKARIPVEVDIASEFRYRHPILDKNELAVFVSQSGQTADTVAALEFCKNEGIKTIGIVNREHSPIERLSDNALHIHAGPEIGVASTKAYTNQLGTLYFCMLKACMDKGLLTQKELCAEISAVSKLPGMMSHVLGLSEKIEKIAYDLQSAQNAIFLGRGLMYPLAQEGALKLKEISYIHAEGFAAGELKHGPIALIEPKTQVVVFAPFDNLFEKTRSNMQEVIARGAEVILITDTEGEKRAQGVKHIISLPSVESVLTPILYALPGQILAYHTAVAKGTDVDQPRNLAKSVTVE